MLMLVSFPEARCDILVLLEGNVSSVPKLHYRVNKMAKSINNSD